MMPLWTTAILPAASRCGCALRSVGRPCVAQRVWPTPVVPRKACGVGLGECALQICQPAGASPNRQVTVPVDQRDTGRVVTPVFHPAQRVDDNIEGGLVPDVADDTARSPSG